MKLTRQTNRIKNFRKKIKSGPVIGAWIQLPDINLALLISQKNFDWLCFDLEHGVITFADLKNIVCALNNLEKPILTRINVKEICLIPKLLDLGIDGVIIASIENQQELKEVLDYSFYPPKGKRGLGYATFNNFSLSNFNLRSYKPIIIPMIENKECLKNLDSIINFTKDVDAFFIGPVDLSLSIGDNLRFDSNFKKTVNNIKNKINQSKTPVGIHVITDDKKVLNKRIKEGFKFIAYSTDTTQINKYFV